MKTLICLANSRKISGRCIAGIEVDSNPYKWIRPISDRDTGEISEEERRYENGDMPQLLDVIQIPMLKAAPHSFQQENHIIDDTEYWEKKGVIDFKELAKYVETKQDELWMDGNSSYNGLNDRVSTKLADSFKHSLYLIKPENLKIVVSVEGAEFNNAKRKVRALFSLGRTSYKLGVTDPRIEKKYLSSSDGEYDLSKKVAYICVSLAEEYAGNCYKLVASIITK